MNRKQYLKHYLIALQILPKDDPINNNAIDHINHDRTDYHLSNLRWCSSSDNQFNKPSFKGVQYDFINDIPDEVIVVDYYDTKTERSEFEQINYYYYHNDSTNNDTFYCKIEVNIYRILHINIVKVVINIFD